MSPQIAFDINVANLNFTFRGFSAVQLLVEFLTDNASEIWDDSHSAQPSSNEAVEPLSTLGTTIP